MRNSSPPFWRLGKPRLFTIEFVDLRRHLGNSATPGDDERHRSRHNFWRARLSQSNPDDGVPLRVRPRLAPLVRALAPMGRRNLVAQRPRADRPLLANSVGHLTGQQSLPLFDLSLFRLSHQPQRNLASRAVDRGRRRGDSDHGANCGARSRRRDRRCRDDSRVRVPGHVQRPGSRLRPRRPLLDHRLSPAREGDGRAREPRALALCGCDRSGGFLPSLHFRGRLPVRARRVLRIPAPSARSSPSGPLEPGTILADARRPRAHIALPCRGLCRNRRLHRQLRSPLLARRGLRRLQPNARRDAGGHTYAAPDRRRSPSCRDRRHRRLAQSRRSRVFDGFLTR